MMRIHTLIRNWFCGSIALYLIAAGYVRRAQRQATRGGVVTSIYFHNPHRRLFEQCIAWLTRNGYRFISLRELIAILHGHKEPPPGAVWLSFDDGFRELKQNVIPLVRERSIPITLFIPTGIIEGDGLFPWRSRHASREALTVPELKAIAGYSEVTLGSHTVNHMITRDLTEEDLEFELAESRRKLEHWTDREVVSFAYPVGLFSGHESAALARCGYVVAVTTENALVTDRTDAYFVPRFSIGDDISYPEAICNMTGVWRPVIDPLIRMIRRFSKTSERSLARSTEISTP
jgi:peptidoglycan/xylan/chitin deacetylase (PgdA/CDA1 family)